MTKSQMDWTKDGWNRAVTIVFPKSGAKRKKVDSGGE